MDIEKETVPETNMVATSAEISDTLPSVRMDASNTKLQAENHAKENTLAEAKDRAQLTATTAMSIVNVALLKELLERGRENNKFYDAVLWLICLSLVFQVLVGALAMTVSYMRNYFKKYGDDMCDDFLSNICWVKIRKKSKHSRDAEHGISCCSCCPLYITTDVYPHHEYTLLSDYDDWCAKVTDYELQAAEAAVNLNYMTTATKEARDKLQDLDGQKEKALITAAEFDSKVEEINRHLEAAKKRKLEYVSAQKAMQISHDRGVILEEKADDIRRNHVLKQISFWQSIINFLLYFVFIFNAFIAGLGIFAGSGDESSAAAGSVAATP